jgi:hypothetical protein
MTSDAAQLIATSITGLVAVVVALIQRRPSDFRQKESNPPPTVTGPTSEEPPMVPGPTTGVAPKARVERSLLDLAVVLVLSSLFSALLVDAILISGRVPTLGLIALFQIALITIGTTAALTIAWRVDKSEAVVGVLAVGTMIVLALAPGIPGVNSGGAETGISLTLPVTILAFLAATCSMYLLGVPTSGRGWRTLDWLSVASPIVLVAFSAGILGWQYRNQALNNPLTPRFSGENLKKAADLLGDLVNRPLRERGIFYQTGSEIALARHYAEGYIAYFVPDVKPVTPATKAAPPPVSATVEATGTHPNKAAGPPSKSAAQTPVSAKATERVTSRSQDEDGEEPDDRPIKFRMVNDVYRTIEEGLSPEKTLELLQDRLRTIHPAITDRNDYLDIPLPGTTAENRYKRLSHARIAYALSLLPTVRDYYVNNLNYDPILKTWLQRPTNGILQFLDGQSVPGDTPDNKKLFSTTIRSFPRLAGIHVETLYRELAFPNEYEAYLTYRTYAQAALAKFGSDDPVRLAWDSFSALAPKSRRAFMRNISIRPAGERKLGSDPFAALLTFASLRHFHLSPRELNLPGMSLSLANYLDLLNTKEIPNTVPAWIGGKDALEELKKLSATDRRHMAELLRGLDSKTSLGDLLNDSVFEFARQIRDKLVDSQPEPTTAATGGAPPNNQAVPKWEPGSRSWFLALTADPVTPTVKVISAQWKGDDAVRLWLPDELDLLVALDAGNQEQLLHYLAIDLYRPIGSSSLNASSLTIVQTDTLSRVLSYLCATLINVPYVLVAVFLGAWASRKLVERDRARALIAAERWGQDDPGYVPGVAVEIQGREPLIERLGLLSGRGWSTIAVVGRRGIGKSRILYELYSPSQRRSNRFAIAVWIAAPAQFNEEDFIESALEQLVANTERAVSNHLRAAPYPMRVLELRMAWAGVAIVAAACVALGMVFVEMDARLSLPQIRFSWFPVGFVALMGAAVLVLHFARLQPVDLSPWLERDRSRNPQTVLLYRRARQALAFLRGRRSRAGADSKAERVAFLPFFAGVLLGPLTLICLLYAIISMIQSDATSTIYSLLCLAGLGLPIYLLTQSRFGRGARNETSGLMALIAEYRLFAAEAVERLKRGALDTSHALPKVLVCIDELDKIVALDEIRMFIRRVKAIFEVPGVYYYISLSEDTLAALYLGLADGKNEIDSSLDHIVRVPPLSRRECRGVVDRYLERREGKLRSEIIDAVVLVSFGVPRDAIRRCDELLAEPGREPQGPSDVFARLIADQVAIAAEAFSWSKGRVDLFRGPRTQVTAALRELLGQTTDDREARTLDREARTLMLLLVDCYMDLAFDMKAINAVENGPLDQLYDLGYRLVSGRLPDLVAELNAIGTTLGEPPAVRTGDAKA